MKAIINEQDVLFSVPGISMGNQRISWLKDGVDSAETLQAFRLDPDNRLLPADGVWRTHDDPAIGSGIVMRTQGGVSVVLIYSYNNEGQATWQIASGQFDENGLMAAQLYAPTDGVPISNDDMTSGQVGDSGALEIQLQGTNLATLRIDGSASKTIQYYNFGLTNHDTEMFTVNEESYSFPDLVGSWVLVDDNLSTSSVWQMERYYPNCCQSPPDPNYFDSVGYTNRTWNGVSGQPPDLDFLIHLNCVKSQPPYSNYVYPELPYCYGSNFGDDENYSMKMYYEDISVNEFIYYVGPRDLQSFYGSYETINRESKRYQLFRLSTD